VLLLLLPVASAWEAPADYRASLYEGLAARISDLVRIGRLEEAVELAERIEDHVGPSAQIAYELSLALRAQGEAADSRRWLDRTLERDPNHAGAHYDRGELRMLEGDVSGALQDFAAAARLRPDHWAGPFRLAHLAGKTGDARAFEQHLQEALRQGFDFRTVVEDPEWKRWSTDAALGPVLSRLISAYGDESVLEQLRAPAQR
jgi:tetratricopeptide (TPR) repeat protein